MNWLAALQRHARDNRPCVLVVLTDVQGSAPRPAGTRMVVSEDDFSDTLGGGALEMEAISHARALLASGRSAPAISSRTIVLGNELSQCCGGRVTLQFDCLPAIDFLIHVFGAGHVAQEVARILQRLPCIATFHDSRPDWLQQLTDVHGMDTDTGGGGGVGVGGGGGSVPGAAIRTRLLPENVHAAVEDCEAGACYLVMTHSHELDLELVEAILSRGDARYCGLIASKSKAARFRSRLSRKGFSAAEIEGLTAPIGGTRRSGHAPMEVAVAAVAEILQLRHSMAEVSECVTDGV